MLKKILYVCSLSNNLFVLISLLEETMAYNRYINNKVIQNCLRPQRKDWCAPTTVAEVVNILLKKEITPDRVAKTMGWSSETITGGKLGTGAVLRGINGCSMGKIKTKTLNPRNIPDHWERIKDHLCHENRVLYYHEPGHHVSLCGYIEEALIDPKNVWDHSHVGKKEFRDRKCWVVKAEHNIKLPENVAQGLLVQIDFAKLCENIREKKNSDLVLCFYHV